MLVRENYGRNLFRVLKEFGLTPASPDFYNMTPEQLDFMIVSLQQDNREQELANKGLEETDYVYDPNFNWEGDMEYGGEKNDEDEIRKLLGEDAYNKRQEIFNSATEGMSRKIEQDKIKQDMTREYVDKHNAKLGFVPEDDDEIDTI